MDQECEHLDGDFVGKCAICGDMVCGECFQTLFNTVICAAHEHLEDESAWELVGFYTDRAAVAQTRFDLEDKEIASIIVEGDEETVELYIPLEEREHADEVLMSSPDDAVFCEDCRIQYSPEMGACPVCGKPAE